MFRFHSGRTGQLIAQHVPAAPNVGAVVLGDAGDIDGDGRDDFAFHVRETTSSFAVRVVSPWAGQLHSFAVAQGTAGLNYIVRLDDLNSDGKGEFGLGDSAATVAGIASAGRLDVRDGRTGVILRTEAGTSALQYYAVKGVGDLDADGVLDYIAKAGGSTFHAISAATGAMLFSFAMPAAPHPFAPVGDVDGDGRADFACMTMQIPVQAFFVYGLEIRSGANGAVMWSAGSTTQAPGIESATGSAGDVDGDGHGDFVVQSSYTLAAPSSVISGRTFTPLVEFPVAAGRAVASPGDADGDGVPDLWFLTAASHPSQIVSGLAAGVTMSGTACMDSTGLRPTIGVGIGARLGQTLSLNLSNGHPNALVAMLGVGFSNTNWNSLSLPVDLGSLGHPGLAGCLWSVAADTTFAPATVVLPAGRRAARHAVAVPNDPLLLGVDLFWQWLVLEAGPLGAHGAVSRAARTRVVP